jgi:two-component system cell cycle sensor histidine kinase/response regulator CckA
MTYSAPVVRDGQVVGLRGLVVDVSDRKRAEAEQAALQRQLEEAQRLESIGRLAGGVAHDFNTLLTPILGNAEAALAELGPAHPLAADLRAIVEAAERAGGLTSQLLAIGRRQVLQDRRLDLNAEVGTLHSLLRRTIGADVEVRLSLAPDLWPVRGDPSQIHQVLLNLAVNARDAMPSGGVLTIGTRNLPAADGAGAGAGPRDLVELTVADTGVGIGEETRARIFEPFFTTKGPGKGTGLGLSTVLGVVKQHGGEIEVRSAPGAGATFRVLLPRGPEATAGEASTAPPPAPAVGPGTGPGAAARSEDRRRTGTILVVEDESGVRRLVESFLRGAGHTVLVAPDASQALALAGGHAGRIDLLLTDVVMPGMNGRELHQALRAGRPALPVLYMSGYPALPSSLQDLVDGDRDAFIAKPFTRAQLLARVEAMLGAG